MIGGDDVGFPGIAARWLAASGRTQLFRVDASGVVVEANAAAAAALLATEAEVVGAPLNSLLSPESAARLTANDGSAMLLTFGTEEAQYSLDCMVYERAGERWLIGEQPAVDTRLEPELRRANNELAVLAREYARQAVELRTVISERERAEWTLAKIGEVLPICMSCGDVQPGEGSEWETLAAFLMENEIPLSHGYCPPCAAKVMEARRTSRD